MSSKEAKLHTTFSHCHAAFDNIWLFDIILMILHIYHFILIYRHETLWYSFDDEAHLNLKAYCVGVTGALSDYLLHWSATSPPHRSYITRDEYQSRELIYSAKICALNIYRFDIAWYFEILTITKAHVPQYASWGNDFYFSAQFSISYILHFQRSHAAIWCGRWYWFSFQDIASAARRRQSHTFEARHFHAHEVIVARPSLYKDMQLYIITSASRLWRKPRKHSFLGDFIASAA